MFQNSTYVKSCCSDAVRAIFQNTIEVVLVTNLRDGVQVCSDGNISEFNRSGISGLVKKCCSGLQ